MSSEVSVHAHLSNQTDKVLGADVEPVYDCGCSMQQGEYWVLLQEC